MRPIYDCAYCLGPVDNDERRLCDSCQAKEDAADARMLERMGERRARDRASTLEVPVTRMIDDVDPEGRVFAFEER